LNDIKRLELLFFEVLQDLKDYLDDLTLVGSWLSYVYSKFLWHNLEVQAVTTKQSHIQKQFLRYFLL